VQTVTMYRVRGHRLSVLSALTRRHIGLALLTCAVVVAVSAVAAYDVYSIGSAIGKLDGASTDRRRCNLETEGSFGEGPMWLATGSTCRKVRTTPARRAR
jgi:hypothetical protein